jgi:hypothetical protein
MSRPSYPFEPQAAERIVAYIRSGGFPLMAAEAAGVEREVFLHWIRRGQRKNAREPWCSFAQEVREAIAQGRLTAEIAVFSKDPKYWLKHGPGKETAANPGWTGEVKPLTLKTGEKGDVVSSPEWTALAAVLWQALANFPEARLAVAQALETHFPQPSAQESAAGERTRRT